MLIYETASLTYKSDKNPNFLPITIKSKKDEINVIWNSRYAYQKFQAYLAGKINKNNYQSASEEMLDSKWAKQTPKRAEELSSVMKSCKI